MDNGPGDTRNANAAPPGIQVTPTVLKSAGDGMQQDVVKPLDQMVRALDPDAGLPHDALGEIGVDALKSHYEPFHGRQCEDMIRGRKSAEGIAEAVLKCANTYASSEQGMVDYQRGTLYDFRAAEENTSRLWQGLEPLAPPQGDSLSPSVGLSNRLTTALQTAGHAGALLDDLAKGGNELVALARDAKIHHAAALADVGQSAWKTAIFDASALFTTLSAQHYVRNVADHVGEHTLPAIMNALWGAWSGTAKDNAITFIEKFSASVLATKTQADHILSAFDNIISRYQDNVAQIGTICGQVHSRVDALRKRYDMNDPQLPHLIQEIYNDSRAGATHEVEKISQTVSSELQSATKWDWLPFPVIDTPLPEAQTWKPGHSGGYRAV
jgi:hypothetical protein